MADNDIDNIHVLKIREIMPNRSANEISFIFQYYGNDVDSTISAFQDGTASEILKKMNVPAASGKSSLKNKRKNKRKKKTSQVDPKLTRDINTMSSLGGDDDEEEEDSVAEPAVTPHEPTHSRNEESLSPVDTTATTTIASPTTDGPISSQVNHNLCNMKPSQSSQEERVAPKIVNEILKNVTPPPVALPNPMEPVAYDNSRQQETIEEVTDCVNPNKIPSPSKSPENFAKPLPRNRNKSTSSFSQSRTTSVSEESSSRPGSQLAGYLGSSHLGQGTKILEKSVKDLSRQTVALSRLNNLLEDELENSSKRIKNAISEAQRLLLERQATLETEMERVKRESRQLLTQRKETAAELKQRADRASTLSEPELQELRADIKQFVVDRKLDDELGKTHRFIYDKDRITEEITKLGEINHVKNNYSQRRQSVSSVGSSTCLASWNKEETASECPPPTSVISNIIECPSDIGTTNSSSSMEQFNESKPSHPPYTARSRVFINTGRIANADHSGGGGGGGGGGSNPSPGISGGYPRGGHRPYGPRGRSNYHSEGQRGNYHNEGQRGNYHSDGQRGGRGGQRQGYNNYGKPHYNRFSNPPPSTSHQPQTDGEVPSHPPRNQRPPPNRSRGPRNPRYNSYHNPRHNNNNQSSAEAFNKDNSQVNGSSDPPENKNLVNGFDH